MATERNVVDFKIHNLTEEQFQELKAQGKIDPNAVYCTPDDSLKTSQITNCITEIPQDIKIQTSGETCTLKAGSKVYIPNGAGVFNETVIPDDISNSGGATDAFVVTNGRNLNWSDSAFSGTTAPSAPTTGTLWYDTANNLVKRFTSAGYWVSGFSLPVALFNSQDNSKTKIFNGFGYIGSTVFALPGIKGLIPNGRNEDGTLKNIELSTSSVLKATDASTSTNVLIINNSNISRLTATNYFYDEQKNIIINKYNNAQMLAVLCGFNKTNNGVISEFATKTAFHAVDYSDFETLSDTVETLSDTVETLSDTVETLSDTVETNNDNAVHQTGDETIRDTKTFAAPSLRISNVAGTGGTGLNILDSNGKGQTYLHHFYTGGRYYSRLVNRNATAEKTAYVEVVVDDDGKSVFTSYNVDAMRAPTPASTSNDTNIATTAWVRDLFETLYPVGSLYITSTNATTCPLASIVKKSDGSNSTWALVSSGRALWTGTGSNGNTTIAAGLPNITGTAGVYWTEAEATGAFFVDTAHKTSEKNNPHGTNNLGFNASRSSSIYGRSTTVQPPAYVVNVWRRTA